MVSKASMLGPCLLAQSSASDATGVRVLSGMLLLALVCVLLAVPVVIALRSAARRRREAIRSRDGGGMRVDPWRESARRMETPS
jgi:hypothetical protein